MRDSFPNQPLLPRPRLLLLLLVLVHETLHFTVRFIYPYLLSSLFGGEDEAKVSSTFFHSHRCFSPPPPPPNFSRLSTFFSWTFSQSKRSIRSSGIAELYLICRRIRQLRLQRNAVFRTCRATSSVVRGGGRGPETSSGALTLLKGPITLKVARGVYRQPEGSCPSSRAPTPDTIKIVIIFAFLWSGKWPERKTIFLLS